MPEEEIGKRLQRRISEIKRILAGEVIVHTDQGNLEILEASLAALNTLGEERARLRHDLGLANRIGLTHFANKQAAESALADAKASIGELEQTVNALELERIDAKEEGVRLRRELEVCTAIFARLADDGVDGAAEFAAQADINRAALGEATAPASQDALEAGLEAYTKRMTEEVIPQIEANERANALAVAEIRHLPLFGEAPAPAVEPQRMTNVLPRLACSRCGSTDLRTGVELRYNKLICNSCGSAGDRVFFEVWPATPKPRANKPATPAPEREGEDALPPGFVRQRYGAVVATIFEGPDGALEVQYRGPDAYSITVHSRFGETDRFGDLSCDLKGKHLRQIGTLAPTPTAPDRAADALRAAAEPFIRAADVYDSDAAAGSVGWEDDSFEVWKDINETPIREAFRLGNLRRLKRAVDALQSDVAAREATP